MTSRRQRTIIFAGFLFALSAFLYLPASAKEKAWLFNQTNPSSPYSKSQMVIACANGLRLSGSNIRVLIPAPDYKVSIFNDATHQYFEAPLDVWISKYVRDFAKTHKHLSLCGRGRVAGLEALRYELRARQPGGPDRVLREIWIAKDLGLPKKIQDLMLAMVGLPPDYGVPLKVTRILPDNTRENVVNTLVAKKIDLPYDAFKKPSGYKKAKSELALLLNYGKEDEIEQLMPPN
ncbi:MAG TPA: hypothetical protein V6D17_16450 [Candidatus Obscuribacterales bacterium]